MTNANPDAVYYAGESDDGTTFIKALRTAKPGIVVVVSDRLFTQLFVDTLGKAADGIAVTCPCIPSDQAGGDYASRYQAAYKATAGYTARRHTTGRASSWRASPPARPPARTCSPSSTHTTARASLGRTSSRRTATWRCRDSLIWSYKITSPYTSAEA